MTTKALVSSISSNLKVNHSLILPSRSVWDPEWALMYQMNGVKQNSNVCYVGDAKKQREEGITVIQNRKMKSVPYAKATRTEYKHNCLQALSRFCCESHCELGDTSVSQPLSLWFVLSTQMHISFLFVFFFFFLVLFPEFPGNNCNRGNTMIAPILSLL